MKKSMVLFLITFFINQIQAQDFSLYQKKIFVEGNDTLRYRILFPENYNSLKLYPVVVFLHGIGERGYDNEAQLVHGGELFLRDSVRKKYPAIIIFPQCPPTLKWTPMNAIKDSNAYTLPQTFQLNPTTEEKLIKNLLDNLVHKKTADSKRIYVAGLSMGGFGSYDLLTRYGNYFAAAFVICGQAHVNLLMKTAKNIPLWIFHGAKDDVVNIAPDRLLYKALKAVGDAKVKYTEYANTNHNSWDSAFAEPDLLSWLFSQKNK